MEKGLGTGIIMMKIVSDSSDNKWLFAVILEKLTVKGKDKQPYKATLMSTCLQSWKINWLTVVAFSHVTV